MSGRFSVSGRVACVTGASSGIGAAFACGLGARGVSVHLTGRSAERLEAVAEQVRAAGGEASVHPAELTEEAELRRLAAAVENLFDEAYRVHGSGITAAGRNFVLSAQVSF